MPSPPAVPSIVPAPPGRREQHKARTRAALSAATRDLIKQHGYDQVVVRDICLEAGVSPRSFYRYFTGKHDAALAVFADFLEVYVSLVEARPADEHPIDSCIAAIDEASRLVRSGLGDAGLAEELANGFDLVEAVPEVGGWFNWLAGRSQDQLTDHFAARLGSKRDDPLPRLCAAASTAAFHAATRSWMRLPASKRKPARVFDLGREALEAYATGLRDFGKNGDR